MKTKNVIALLIVSAALFLFIGQSVQAFSISPHTLDIELDPEKTYEDTLILYDESLKGATLKLEVKGFSVNSETGKFDQLIEPLAGEDDWVKFDQDTVELPASGESVEVPFSITVPADAEAGTHQIAISYLEQPKTEEESKEESSSVDSASEVTEGKEEENKDIELGSRTVLKTVLVTNIFLRVEGLVIEKADIDVFTVTRDPEDLESEEEKEQGYKVKDFFERTPVYFVIKFHNRGNVHLRPDGNIKMTDRKGNIKFKEKASEEISIVPAQSTREYIVGPFEDKFAIGQFFAEGTMLYGNDTKEASKSVEFFIFPWKIALLKEQKNLNFISLFFLLFTFKIFRITSNSKNINISFFNNQTFNS